METKLTFKPVVRNVGTNDLYFYEGENVFKNIRTDKFGTVDDETARKVFKFNIEATELINEFPIIETMIKQLNLKADVLSVQV
jgi:hypothetical protein